MSTASKITLTAACIISAATVGYVHYKQMSDRFVVLIILLRKYLHLNVHGRSELLFNISFQQRQVA